MREHFEKCFKWRQLVDITYSDSTPPISFTYDEAGRLTSVTDASGTRTFTHTPGGRTLTDSIEVDGAAYTLYERYDGFGRPSGYTLSNTVDDVSSLVSGMAQSYDFAGRISEISVPGIVVPFRYGYMPGTDLIASLAMPNGVTRETVYEPRRDLPASVTHTNAAGAFLTRRAFTRDAAGRLTGRTQFRLDGGTDRLDTFGYNPRSELTQAVLGTNNYAYLFDQIGNRERSVENTATNIYTANHLNQYTAIATPEQPDFIPAFDADGNQTLIRTHTGVWQVAYNAENRPVSFVNTNSQTVVDAGYDYMGRMFSRRVTVNNTVTSHERYLYRGFLRVAALDMLDNAATRHTVVWDPTEPSATRPLLLQTPDGWHTYGFDQVKNVTELFDSSGGISAAYDYAPFGQTTASSGPAADINPLRFSSEIHGPALGTAHYNYRPLNHLDGRFMGRDPIGKRGGLNLYGFVKNNPANKTDYLGLVEWEKTITLSGHEWHSFGCPEWEEFTGQGDAKSYRGHFIKYTLGEWAKPKLASVPLTIPGDVRRNIATQIISGLGMNLLDETTLWEVNLESTKLAYTKKYKKHTACYRDIQVQVLVITIAKMTKGASESTTVYKGPPSKEIRTTKKSIKVQ